MGNETSTPSKEPADGEDGAAGMPHRYAASSVTSPTGGGSRSSVLSPKVSGTVTPISDARADTATPPAAKDPRNNMIVVSRVTPKWKKDPALEALQKIPSFLPIIGTSVGSTINRDMPMIDDKFLVVVCNRFKEHVTTSAKRVTARQDEIGERVRWVEKNASARANRLGKIAQLMQKAEDRLVDVTALQTDVLRINDMIHYAILPKLAELNSMLPEDHQLEPALGVFQPSPPPPLPPLSVGGTGGQPVSVAATPAQE